jgi:predicted enzyme related to lactoylglutathione lyase
MHAAVLYVSDLNAMRAFYATCLAMDAPPANDGDFCVLHGTGGELTLVQVPSRGAVTVGLTDPPGWRESSPVKLVFDVIDIDETRVAVLAAGGQDDPARPGWNFRGHRHQDVCDPEGNIIQLRQPAAG